MDFVENLSHYGDIAAIPFFGLLTYYFYTKPRKTRMEKVLMLFSASGLMLDIVFTLIYLIKSCVIDL